MNPLRIALVDDHQLFRKGMVALVDRIEDVHLALEAANGRELLDGLEKTTVDLVLLDLKMPVLDGRATLEELQQRYPEVKVIFLTMEDGEETILRCMEDGAHGFLAKDAHPDEVRLAIRSIREKGVYINSTTSMAMMRGLGNWKRGERDRGLILSEREKTILKGICQQRTTAEIADQLFLSPRTVEGYRRSLLEKTETKNSLGLVLFAASNGWLERWMNEAE